MNRYSVIYVDPPWSYNDKTPRGGAERHYRTLTPRQLVNFQAGGLRVSELAAENCALFMWATWPLLPEAIWLMGVWGFTYKNCAFNWVKTTKSGGDAVGLGHYTRGNSEPCLLGVQGKIRRVDAGVRQTLITEEALFSPRLRHSAKPAEARDRIVRLLGDVPRVELFARERVPGWDSFGDELPEETSCAG